MRCLVVMRCFVRFVRCFEFCVVDIIIHLNFVNVNEVTLQVVGVERRCGCALFLCALCVRYVCTLCET